MYCLKTKIINYLKYTTLYILHLEEKIESWRNWSIEILKDHEYNEKTTMNVIM